MMTREQLETCRLVRHEAGSRILFVDGQGAFRRLETVARDHSRDSSLVLRATGEEDRTLYSGSDRDCAHFLDDAASHMRTTGAEDVFEGFGRDGIKDTSLGYAPMGGPGIHGGPTGTPDVGLQPPIAPRKNLATQASGYALLVAMIFAAGSYVGLNLLPTVSAPSVSKAPVVIGGDFTPSQTGASDLEAMASIAKTPVDETKLISAPAPTQTPAPAEGTQVASAAPTAPAAASPLLIDGEPAPEPGKGDEGIAVKADDPTAKGPAPAQPEIPLPAGPLTARADAAKVDAQTKIADAKTQLASVGAEQSTSDLATMQEALRAIQNGEKLDPAILEKLPVDIAKKLKEENVLLGDKEAALVSGKKLSEPLVTLPDAVVDGLKDADGVPTVPSTNFWAATGGNVRLPLPGGGDIVDPSVFAEFGL